MTDEHDDGLPDEAFTEEELRAGVQHIMRSGGASRHTIEEDEDYASVSGGTSESHTQELRFNTFAEASAWAKDHPGKPFTRCPDGRGFLASASVGPPAPARTSAPKKKLFGGRLYFPGAHPIIQFLEELRVLSPHLHHVWNDSRFNQWKTIVPPFSAQKFDADLSRLGREDIVRLKDLLDDHFEYEKKDLAWLLSEIRRDRRMKAGHYGEDLKQILIEIEGQAIAIVAARLA